MVKLREIVKTRNVIKISPSDTLSSALSKLTTSHDAAFVFSDENKFMGVINPYYCLIKSSHPGNAKVEHCIYHVPKIMMNYSLERTARLMSESKVHYLPVFNDKDVFTGIVSARHLLQQVKNNSAFHITIEDFLKSKKKEIITISEEDFIPTAVHLFKRHKISKLIVINKDMKLKGVLTYYDLITFLMTPKERLHPGEREGNKTSFQHQKVKNFAKSYVLTLKLNDTMENALHLILDKKIGSVVIVDEERHPLGIITTKDILNFIISRESERKIEVISRNLSLHSRQVVGGFFDTFSYFVRKVPGILKARLFVSEEKNGGIFKIMLAIFPRKGASIVIKKEGKNLKETLVDVKNKLRRTRA